MTLVLPIMIFVSLLLAGATSNSCHPDVCVCSIPLHNFQIAAIKEFKNSLQNLTYLERNEVVYNRTTPVTNLTEGQIEYLLIKYPSFFKQANESDVSTPRLRRDTDTARLCESYYDEVTLVSAITGTLLNGDVRVIAQVPGRIEQRFEQDRCVESSDCFPGYDCNCQNEERRAIAVTMSEYTRTFYVEQIVIFACVAVRT
ncbi:uncharacterized protein LOC117106319 [Anneissia japonica]|uniref:uncharacterized protein LOC117106319 n=1 Tax=Anneissia japonica TaxID=1529436 RepID=UPI0014258413|nr:uncharacterized protein LOC117106319 [Anneissia japonica]